MALPKLAVTLRASLIVTLHAPVPLHAPAQPPKLDPADADAVSVTSVPGLYRLTQLAAQLASVPAGEKLTVPDPAPALV